ncbi:hypothetical protein BDV10DRAFT_180263 [Aspergillus recurvatus]
MPRPSRTNRNTMDLLPVPMSMFTMILWTVVMITITTAMNPSTFTSTSLYRLIPLILAIMSMPMLMLITIPMRRSMRIHPASWPSHRSRGGRHICVRCTRHVTDVGIIL